MHRRHFMKAGLAGAALAAAGAPAGAASAPAPGDAAPPDAAQPGDARVTYELRTYELRSDIAPDRADQFFERALVPALRRVAAGPVGCFAPDVGLPTQSRVLLVPYASPAAMLAAADRLAADAELRAARQAWERGPGLPYVRYEAALYRAFAGHPRPETPPARAAGAPPRLYELRTYEAPHETGLQNKVAMFDQEEIRIFRAVGLAPVWFGAAVAAPRMPHLAYMLAFDDQAARAAAWGRFVAHPDWQRIRTRPGWTDPEAVSTIHSAFLRPTGASDFG